MAQKDYSLEIVWHLLHEKSHLRGLAKKMNTNHMMVSRKINELIQENIVDFVREGKNKVYYLKKTAEAQAYVFMAEQYVLLKVLRKYPELRNIVEKINRNKKVKLAVLFGSYAKSLAHKDSDIDLFIETGSKTLKKEITLLDSRINVKIGKYNPDSLLSKEIEKNHAIIKGVDVYYEKNNFFN